MLEARNLTKRFNRDCVVDRVSFVLKPGEVLGYLGPNGAGKTTTIRMLCGLLTPSRGQIFFKHRTIHDDLPGYKKRLGYVPEQGDLYTHQSPFEYMELVGRLHLIPENRLHEKIEALLTTWGLRQEIHVPMSSFSKGMRQKVLLLSALIHDPDILLLDEPLSGLDVTSILVFRDLIAHLAGRGKIIVYSSHVLEVVEKICSHVIIIDRGRILAHDSISNLSRLMASPDLETIFRQLVPQTDTHKTAEGLLQILEG